MTYNERFKILLVLILLCIYLVLVGCATAPTQSNEMQVQLPIHEVCKFNRIGIILHRKIQQVIFECSL